MSSEEDTWAVVEGIETLDEETGFFVPKEPAPDPELLIYLHGITPPTPTSPNKTMVQTSVRDACARAGAYALVPRGQRHIGPDHAKDWWAWPSSPDVHEQLAGELVARILSAKRALEARLGIAFVRTYLAGGSIGARFLCALALRDDLSRLGFNVDGLGIMSGAATLGISSIQNVPKHRTYLGYGSNDEPVKAPVNELRVLLEGAEWPLHVAVHPFGHGSHAEYIDEAFAFWRATPLPSDRGRPKT